MNIDTFTLKCFIAVANSRSFTQAASRVGRTQSAVSQQISKLEHLLDHALFDRDKHLKLTNEGETFLGYAEKILQLHLAAIDHFKTPELTGQVTFGLPEDFAAVYLADVLVDFVNIHPRILLNVECDLTLNLYDRFKNNEFDLVLVKMSRPQDFPNGVEVWSEQLVWVGEESLISNLQESTVSVPLVVSPQPCVYRARAIQTLNDATMRWHVIFTSTSYSSTVAAVTAGLGITVLPKTMVPHGLHVVDTLSLPKLNDTHISLLKHNESDPVVQSFEKFVLNKIRL